MKTFCCPVLLGGRQGMSRASLLAGLVLWIAVFGGLYFLYLQRADQAEGLSENRLGEAGKPIIVDKTAPDQASARTAHTSFPAKPLTDFDLLDCDGGKFGLSNLKGKRWVASFVFSRCASTCPMISGAMMALRDRIEGKADDVVLVTITVDPKYDTVEVFRKYAENFRPADSSDWKFLTGDQQEIYELIVNGFGLYVAENQGEHRQSGFEVAHTNRVVLVNEDAIPVGTFLGTRDEDMVELRRILTGRSDFPKAGPLLKSGAPKGVPGGGTYEIVPRDDEPKNDKPKNDDGANAKEGQQAAHQNFRPAFLLTHMPLTQEDEGAANTASDETTAPANAPANATSDGPKTTGDKTTGGKLDAEQSVADFNENLNRQLPGWARSLPTVNAALNSVATLLLICGYVAIRRKQKSTHRNLMVSAFLVSVAFLASYLCYHYALGKYTGEHGRRFEGTGIWASIYPWVLWPHVVLAVFVPVLGIRVFQFAFREDWERHRKLARITFPIWLYVSVTGVVIYGMLYHWPAA